MDEKIICPICGLECKSDITLKNHVLKMQDDQHIKLAYIYQTLKFKCKENQILRNIKTSRLTLKAHLKYIRIISRRR